MADASYFPNKHPISSGSVFNVLFWGPKHQEDTPILSLLVCPTSHFLHFSHFCLNVAHSLVTFPFPLFFHFSSILFIVHVLCTTHPQSLPPYLSKSFTIYLSLMQVWCLENWAVLEEMLLDMKQANYPDIISCSNSTLYHHCLYYKRCQSTNAQVFRHHFTAHLLCDSQLFIL